MTKKIKLDVYLIANAENKFQMELRPKCEMENCKTFKKKKAQENVFIASWW